MQPFQYDLRSSAAKDNSLTHAAAAPSNLDAATTMRFAASRSKPAPIYPEGHFGHKPPQVLTEGFNAEMAISGLNPQIRFVYLYLFVDFHAKRWFEGLRARSAVAFAFVASETCTGFIYVMGPL